MNKETKESSIIKKFDNYNNTDVANIEYPLTEALRNDPNCIVGIPTSYGDKPLTKREYDKRLDKLINFNFGKTKGLRKIINYFFNF